MLNSSLPVVECSWARRSFDLAAVEGVAAVGQFATRRGCLAAD